MRHSSASRHPRPGLTLVEVLVALVLLAVGALGVASTSALSARLFATGSAIERSAAALGAVVDSLRGERCAALIGGSTPSAGGTVTWSVMRPPRVAQLRVTVTPTPTARVAPFAVETLLPCE